MRVACDAALGNIPAVSIFGTDFEGFAYQFNEGMDDSITLENPDIVRVALDQQLVHQSAPIGEPREIALFPPMTGG